MPDYSIRCCTMSGLGSEAEAFLRALFSGMFLVGIYEVLRILRKLIRHHHILISAEDFLYWLYGGFFIFGEIFRTSAGEIRWYFVAGVVTGAVFFRVLVSKTGKLCGKIFEKKTGKHGKRVD